MSTMVEEKQHTPCLQFGHLEHVTSQANQEAQLRTCAACVEQSKVCKCGRQQNEELVSENDYHKCENSSFAHSVINMIGMLIGLGQLSTPYALENGGWTSVFILLGLGMACAYTSHVIAKCLEEDVTSKSYQDIGKQAFGRKGWIIASIFIYLEIFLTLVSYTISLHDNLSLVFAGTRINIQWLHISANQLLTITAVLVALPSIWLRDLSSISFLSFGGIIMSLLIFITVGTIAALGNVKANNSIPIIQMHKIPGITGLYMFSYAGHIVFPNLYRAMKEPSKFTKVAITSFSLVTIHYTALAIIGAKLFGSSVSSQITLSMPPHLLLTKIALWATVLTPMTKYALEFAPFAIQLVHSLPSSISPRVKMLVRGGVGSVVLLLILSLALSVPYFEYVLSLTGSLISTFICLVFPCTFYLKICWSRVSTPARLLNVLLIVLGGLFGVVGTISSSRALFHSYRSGGRRYLLIK